MKTGDALPGCLGNYCADHLDFHSYRKEKNGPNAAYDIYMETSIGSPDTWRGVCLARPGVTANTETGGTYYDQCKSQNTLTVYYLDGIQNGNDETEYKDFECPNHYACSMADGGHNNYCRYDCSLDSHCASGYYCSLNHCCLPGYRWNAAAGGCEAAPNCADCSYSLYYGSSFNPLSIELPYRTSPKCYYNSNACCIAAKYGSANFKDWYAISRY